MRLRWSLMAKVYVPKSHEQEVILVQALSDKPNGPVSVLLMRLVMYIIHDASSCDT